MLPERLKGIDAFVAAADSGSFTAAASRLKITNSAVGKAVARLEQRLGTRLFARTTRSLSLTDAGVAYYRTCAKILADLEDAEAILTAERLEPAGRLRIDVPVSYGRLHVLPHLLRFANEHPRLRPQISFSDHFVDLIAEEIDIVVRIGGPAVWQPSLGHRLLGFERVIFCASPEYLKRHGPVLSVADLKQRDCIVYKKADGTATSWMFKETENDPGVRHVVDGRIAVGSGDAEVAAVAAGCGVAQLPTWLAQHELESGTIVEILPEASTVGLPISVMWQRSKQELPKVSMVLEVLFRTLTTDSDQSRER